MKGVGGGNGGGISVDTGKGGSRGEGGGCIVEGVVGCNGISGSSGGAGGGDSSGVGG